MIDINSENFVADFKMDQATVGQVGYGFIGNAVVELFRPFCRVLVYDKAGYVGREAPDNTTLYPSLDSVVAQAEVIFVAVPTPMKATGECHTGIVESVLQDIQNSAAKIQRSMNDFVVVIKSTVPPGFTKKMQDRFALRVMFSPEFLTEKNAVKDFKSTNRVILGGEIEDARVVFKYFEGVWMDRQPNTWTDNPDGPVHVIQCDPTEAEMVKLSTNVHLTSRVMISNELYLICRKLGIDYETVKLMTQMDPRIGVSHMNVPGPDGHLGYGGHCFVKDTASLAFIAETIESAPGKTSLFHHLHFRNLDIRDDRDWEAQKGRAVTDE